MAQGQLAPVPKQQFCDSNGNPLPGAKIYFYQSGTSTPLAAYSDGALTTPLANPAVCDAGGFLTYYLQPQAYKIIVKTSADVTQYTVDPVNAVPPTDTNQDISATAGEAISAGEVVYLSAGDGSRTAGRWYKADADLAYASSMEPTVLGIALAAIALGETGTIRTGGRVPGLSGLTTGTVYYVSSTAGALTSTAPSNARRVGKADSTTSLVLSTDSGPLNVRRLQAWIASVGNVGAGEDTLATYTIPAGMLSSNGMGIEGVFWGTMANNANAKTLRPRLIEGATNQTLLEFALTASIDGRWVLQFWVLRTTATAARSGATCACGPENGATSRNGQKVSTATPTWANAVEIRLTGEATADNDIIMEAGFLRLMPLGY